MAERERAYRGEEVVTVLKGKIGGKGSTQIRNSYGFTETIKAKELKRIPSEEKVAKLHYGEPE